MRRILTAVAIAALLAGCGNAQRSGGGERAATRSVAADGCEDQPKEGVAIDGFFIDLPPAEYFDHADAAIRGTVIGTTTTRLEVPSDSDLSGADEQLVTVDVHEVLDGSASATLTISRPVSSCSLRFDGSLYDGPLDPGQEYVFVLSRGTAATGSDDAYVFLGEHAAVPVEDGAIATLPGLASGDESPSGHPIPLDAVREIAQRGQ
jgi:hypothetical protein